MPLGKQTSFTNIFFMLNKHNQFGKHWTWTQGRNIDFHGLIKNKQLLKAKEGILTSTQMGKCQYIQSIQLWEWTHQRKGQSWMILIEEFKTKSLLRKWWNWKTPGAISMTKCWNTQHIIEQRRHLLRREKKTIQS